MDQIRECKHHGKTRFFPRIEKGKQAGWRCRKCASVAVSNRRRKVKKLLVEQFGNKCQICGYNKCISALTFHHKDPSKKEFGLAESGISRSYKKSLVEAKKCILVCRNCHAEIHADITKMSKKLLQFTISIDEQKQKKLNYCKCGKKIQKKSIWCKECFNKHSFFLDRSKINWPNIKALIQMVEEANYSAVGRKLGVTDNAVRKRIKTRSSNLNG